MAATKGSTKAPTKGSTKGSTTTKRTTTKQSTTTKRSPGASASGGSGAKRSTTATRTPRLVEREPRTVARDTGYAAAAVASDALGLVRELPGRIGQLRSEAPATARRTPERALSAVTDLRTRAERQLDSRLTRFEKRFDRKARAGRKVAADLQKDERYTSVESQVKRVVDQTSNTRSQVKAAVTSVRRTATQAMGAGVEAGRAQAGNARSQVKAAATSARRSAGTVADAADELTG